MNTVFLKLLNMSLTASLLILAVLPIRLLMKKAPKQMSCLLWLIVAVALICPVRFESPASVLPVTDPIVITAEAPETSDTLPLYQETPVLIQDIIEQDTPPAKPDYVTIGSTVWCMGMLALLGYAAFSWLRLKKRVAASIAIDKQVFVCDDIDTPFILGILRPHIYLPSALEADTISQVLIHERAHLARKDHWWKPLGYLLLTLHWFNPLVWVAYSLLCTDIELACDEKVIRDLDASGKKAYSEALLSCSMPRHLIAACPLAFGEVGVKQRIAAVLHYKKPAFWVILIAIVVCVALCVGFLTEPVVKNLGELSNHRRDQFNLAAIGSEESYITIDTDLTELFDLLEQVEVHPVELTTQPLDHVIVLSSDNLAWSAYLNFSADYSYLWISYDTSLPYKPFAPGQQSIWHTQGYEVLNPELLQESIPPLLEGAEPALGDTPTIQTEDLDKYLQLDSEDILNTELTNRVERDGAVSSYHTYANADKVCALLAELTTGETPIALDAPSRTADKVIFLTTAHLGVVEYRFTADLSELWIVAGADFSAVYGVENPELLRPLFSGLGELSEEEEAALLAQDMTLFVEEYLKNKNQSYRNLQQVSIPLLDPNTDTYYVLFSLDYTRSDGTVLSENALQLAQIRNPGSDVHVNGIASGQWGQSAGYYPNLTDFNGQLVLWTTHNDTHMKLSEDGTSADANAVEPNDSYTYRIYCENGAQHIWKTHDTGGVFLLPDGEIPTKVVPVDQNYHDITAFAFSEETLAAKNVRTISEASGWDAFMETVAETGKVNALYSYPVYTDMDSSFQGHEALYHAMKTDTEPNLGEDIDPAKVTLAAVRSFNGYEYAAIRYKDGGVNACALLEYTVSVDGSVDLLDYAEGSAPESMGRYGYSMNYSTLSGGFVYWTLFAEKRIATTADGKETDAANTVKTDYTGFRFIWPDLRQEDYTAENGLFLAVPNSVIPPAISIPMVGSTPISALGFNLP